MMTCICGKELKFGPSDYPWNDTDNRFGAYCECKRVWALVEYTESYEENVTSEIVEPEHGEYQKDNVWFYADGVPFKNQ